MYIAAQSLGLGAHLYYGGVQNINDSMKDTLGIPNDYEAQIIMLAGYIDDGVDAGSSGGAAPMMNQNVRTGVGAVYEVDLTALTLSVDSRATPGAVTYAYVNKADSNSIINVTPSVSENKLTFTSNSISDESYTATISNIKIPTNASRSPRSGSTRMGICVLPPNFAGDIIISEDRLSGNNNNLRSRKV